MACLKLLKLAISISFLLITSFHIYPSFAMDGEKENANRITRGARSLYNLVTAVADSIDHLHGNDLYASQRDPFFFSALSDEMVMKVFLYLCEDKNDIENLSSVALTCTHGHQLMQDPEIWKLLEKRCFGHLPEEYITVLLQDKEEKGLKLCGTLFKQLLAYQVDETKWLSQALSGIGMKYWSMLDGINEELRQKWRNKLDVHSMNNTLPNDPLLNDLRKEDGKEALNKEKTKFERYIAQEITLNCINSEIISECLKNPSRKRLPRKLDNYDVLMFSFCYSITRIPQEGVELLKSKLLSLDPIDAVGFDFQRNLLRWMPNEFFLIEKISFLDLNHNLLCYLSKNFECLKDHIEWLCLGNDSPDETLPSFMIRSIPGNTFKVIPPVVFKLSKLWCLGMSNVGLEELPPEETLFKDLPKLWKFNVSHNNLQVVFKPSFKYSYMMASHDNPGSPSSFSYFKEYISWQMEDKWRSVWCYFQETSWGAYLGGSYFEG